MNGTLFWEVPSFKQLVLEEEDQSLNPLTGE